MNSPDSEGSEHLAEFLSKKIKDIKHKMNHNDASFQEIYD
jgi:hypothetical protein